MNAHERNPACCLYRTRRMCTDAASDRYASVNAQCAVRLASLPRLHDDAIPAAGLVEAIAIAHDRQVVFDSCSAARGWAEYRRLCIRVSVGGQMVDQTTAHVAPNTADLFEIIRTPRSRV